MLSLPAKTTKEFWSRFRPVSNVVLTTELVQWIDIFSEILFSVVYNLDYFLPSGIHIR